MSYNIYLEIHIQVDPYVVMYAKQILFALKDFIIAVEAATTINAMHALILETPDHVLKVIK